MKKILLLAMCLVLVPMLFASQRNLEGSAVDDALAPELKMQENTLKESGDRARKIPENASDVMVSPRQLLWDFETGMQGWTSWNGLGYPLGWDVMRYNLHYSAMSPNPGDSSMWIDSDAGGPGLHDTVWSPEVYPLPTMQWLKWGMGYQNYAYVDTFYVGIKQMVGGVWQPPVELKKYAYDVGSNHWDSSDVSAYVGAEKLQIYFAYNDYGIWGWYGSFDNVSIDASFLPPGIVWDFEDGWQGWTHTNGLAFPGGWEPYDATYRSGWGYQCPSSDDSSMMIDSDLYFGATMDTAFSPFLTPNPTMDWLRYGFFYRDIGIHVDYFEVGIKYFDGSTWIVDTLKTYDNADYYGDLDSVDVSAYNTYDVFQVYFYYNAPTWDFYAAFDNVSIDAELAEHDVGCDQIVSPPAGNVVFVGDYDVIGNIKNFGNFTETFGVRADVYDTLDNWNLVFTSALALTNFSPGAESLLNFGVVFFGQSDYKTEIFTGLVGDEHPENDTCSIYSHIPPFDLIWDFETGWQGWTHTNGLPFPEGWDVLASGYKPSWTPPDAGDSTMWIDSDSAGSGGGWIQDTALSPVIIPDATTEWLRWGVGYYHYTGQFMDVGIKYFDGTNWTVVPLRTYNAIFWPGWDSVDVSAYNTSDSMQVYFYFDDLNTWGFLASFDNVMINDYTGVAEKPGETMPLAFMLSQNAPNPVRNGQTTISYITTRKGPVSLKIYDSAGRLVKTLINRNESAGHKTVYWDGKDDNHRSVAAGVYFYRLTAESRTATKKMVIVR